MQQSNRKPAVRRGVKVELTNARVQVFGDLKTTKTGKKFLSVAFFAPNDADDLSAGEVKLRSTLWEEKAEKMLKSSDKARYSVTGYMKTGAPWEVEGRTVVSNEFVVGTIEATKTKVAVEETNDMDDIPF